MEWKSVDFSLDFKDIEETADRVDFLISQIETVLEGKAFVLNLLSSAQAFLSESSSVFSELIASIDGGIQKSAFQPEAQASCYLLDVPLLNPHKRRPLPPRIKSANLVDILLATNIRPPGDNVVGAGGNYGIYHKVIESIFDSGDSARPIFIEGGEMGALVVVYGAHTYLPSLKMAMNLKELLGSALAIPPEVHGQLPVPQNVKIKPTATPAAAYRASRAGSTIEIPTGELAGLAGPVLRHAGRPDAATVTVSWDKIPSISRMRGAIYWKYLRQHLYVKEGSPIKEGEDLQSYEVLSVPVPQLSKELWNGLSVSAQGIPSSCMVTGMDPEETYYISVAFSFEVFDEENDPDGVVFEPTLALLSEQARVRPKEQVPPSEFTRGTPPDWHSVHSPLFVIPEVRQLMDQSSGLLAVVKNIVVDEINDLSVLVENANASVTAISRRVEAIKSVLDRVAAKLQTMAETGDETMGGAGIWGTVFYGDSNRSLFMHKMAEALLDPATENKPPFDTGNEPVGALVFLVEGQSFVHVQTLLEPLAALFGVGDEDGGLPQDLQEPADTDPESPIMALDEDPLRSNAQALAEDEKSISPEDLGFYSEDDGDAADGVALHDIGIDDDPC